MLKKKKKSSFGTFRGVSYNAFEDRAMQLFSDMGNNRAGGQEKADKVRVKEQGGERIKNCNVLSNYDGCKNEEGFKGEEGINPLMMFKNISWNMRGLNAGGFKNVVVMVYFNEWKVDEICLHKTTLRW